MHGPITMSHAAAETISIPTPMPRDLGENSSPIAIRTGSPKITTYAAVPAKLSAEITLRNSTKATTYDRHPIPVPMPTFAPFPSPRPC